MNSKTITYIFLTLIAILGWNAFLIQRDNKMFDAYDKRHSCATCSTGTVNEHRPL